MKAFSVRFIASPPLAAAVTPSHSFIQLSRALTGMAQPDALLAQRLYSWLYADNPLLDTALDELNALLAAHPGTHGAALLTLLAQQPASYASCIRRWFQAGISGWLARCRARSASPLKISSAIGW